MTMGSRNPTSRPSFFKTVVLDFTRHLRLPQMFVQEYGEILPETAKLRINSRETWNVQLERVNDETYCFKRGWTKFAVNVGLKMGEFLVFSFSHDNSTFDVSVYGLNGCKRQIQVADSPTDSIGSDDDVELISVKNNSDSDDGANANPQLNLLLKKHQRSRVVVRKEFAVAAGLLGKKAVVLKCPPKQRCWPVLIEDFPDLPQFRLEMCRGWSEFRKDNGLVYGENYLLEYIPDDNVIECKLVD